MLVEWIEPIERLTKTMFDGFDDEPWYIRAALYVPVTWMSVKPWPILVLVALAIGLWAAC